MSLGLCVLGCGAFAATFAETISGLRGEVDLYFASRDAGRAKEYAAAFNGVDSFGSYEAAAADPRVDAVYICTPHHLHLEHVALTAGRGKHVLVEKPIAGTLADAREIVKRTESAGINLMVAENYRYLSAVQKAKELVEEGRVGQVRLIQLQEQYPFQPSGWRNNALQNGGGVFIDGGIHKASVLAYLTGRPNRVYAQRVAPGLPGLDAEDGIVIMTRSKEGVTGVINHTWTIAPSTERPWVSVLGTEGALYFELGRPWLKVSDGTGEEWLELPDDVRGLAPMVREFRSSIIEGREPAMPGREAIADLALVLKAYESMETGQPVAVE